LFFVQSYSHLAYVSLWRRTTKTVSCLPSSGAQWQQPNTPTRKFVKGTLEMTKESNRPKEIRQKEIEPKTPKNPARSSHLLRQKMKTLIEPQCHGPVGHYPRGPPPFSAPPPPPPPAPLPPHRCPNFPPLAVLSVPRRWSARSRALQRCTSHPPRGPPHATSAFPFRLLLGPRPQCGLLVFPPVTVLEQVVSCLLCPTVVLRVTPPAVVIRPVVHALQIHTREGMP